MSRIQAAALNYARKKRIPLQIYLINGVQLRGAIVAFDPFVIVLKTGANQQQMIYKHAISTIVPKETIPLPAQDDETHS